MNSTKTSEIAFEELLKLLKERNNPYILIWAHGGNVGNPYVKTNYESETVRQSGS